MSDPIKDILIENYVRDLQKKEIDPFFRARLLEELIRNRGDSVRNFAVTYGINYTTVRDWMVMLKISEEEYNRLKSKGLTHTDIYRNLRDCGDKKIDWEKEIKDKQEELRDRELKELSKTDRTVCDNYIDSKINHSIKEFKSIRYNLIKQQISPNTRTKIKELIDILNRMLMYIDK